MAHYADEYTENTLAKLEKKIAKEYAKAEQDANKMAKEFFGKYAKRVDDEEEAFRAAYMNKDRFAEWYKENRQAVSAEQIEDIYKKRKWLNGYSEDYQTAKMQFANYKQSLLGRGERYEKLRDELAQKAVDANATACAYINDKIPSVYSTNYNYEALTIEQWAVNVGGFAEGEIAFNVVNEDALKNLVMDADKIIPRVSADPAIDTQYNIKKVQSIVHSGIATGKPVVKIADDLMKIYGTNRASALRNARTAFASAQNSGHLSAMEYAKELGIPIKKIWRCLHDERTRFSHAMMDLEEVEVEETFSNGLMYPGDRDGDIGEWINCRCRLRKSLEGITNPPKDKYIDWMMEHPESVPLDWNKKQLEHLQNLRGGKNG